MYNGIGLQTARGSGTNGYVQRNLSFVKQIKKPIEYKSEDDFKRLERELNRVPNKDILEHQNKRQIELKCLEMEDQMEQQGFSAEEIEVKVKEFRESLIIKMESSVRKKTEWLLENLPQNVKETHKMAEANHQKNDQLKAALAISPYFIAGSSLDATRKAKEAMAAEQALQLKKYTLIKDPSPEPPPKSSKKDTKEDKHKDSKKRESHKKRNSRKKSSDSESDSENSDSSEDSSRKRKKTKSRNKRSKDNKRHKTMDRKSRKSRKYNDSSSDSDSGSDSDSDSSNDSHSDSSDSSDGNHKSKNSRKNERSRKERRKRSPSPVVDRNRAKPSEIKESTHDFDDYNKTKNMIDMNISQMRKEAQTSVAPDGQQITQNKDKTQETKKNYRELSPKRRSSPIRHRYSRSTSHSSEREPQVKRLKSAVYETSTFKKTREVPKSYDDKRYDTKKDRSLSPNDRSRHSSRSQRSRSRSVHSSDSKSSDRSSRSRSYSSSKSSSNSSKSSSRSKTRSRSPSIPRRKGSPSFLDKRRITSARKRPIPYRRGSPTSSQRSSRSFPSMSGCSSRSLSVSSSDSFNSSAYKLI